ncbi:MAG: TonB family protein [Acidobacteriota bacterium]|nr:TonB family protein [Acidobacteriota bacterium]
MSRILAFFFFAVFLSQLTFAQEPQPKPTEPKTGSGIGVGRGSGSGNGIGSGVNSSPTKADSVKTEPLKILTQPAPGYTELASENLTEGTVRVRVTFSASGEITGVSPVTSLPYGLTEKALAAARDIKFEPAKRDGVPISVTKLIEYRFSMRFEENDKNLKSNAEIIEKPDAVYPEEFKSVSGVVTLDLVLTADGNVWIRSAKTDLPKVFETNAREAATKIKFTPAVHKTGKNVSQRKVIEYVFKQ